MGLRVQSCDVVRVRCADWCWGTRNVLCALGEFGGTGVLRGGARSRGGDWACWCVRCARARGRHAGC